MDLHLGVRHWDHVAPLALGDVSSPDLGVRLSRLDATPDLWSSTEYDGAETSLSRYVRARAAGDDRVVALPVVLMRGFRHRCIIVSAGSRARDAADLAGACIGLTGWPDSGSTWTRAVLREAGVGVRDAQWRVGRLTAAHPVLDRIGGVEVGDNVRPTRDDDTLVDLLRAGDLDALMTPFMPPGFRAPDSDLRTLYRDSRTAEAAYFVRRGFVPGMHVLAVRRTVLDGHPERAQQLLDLFEAAKQLSWARRSKLMDVTPWQNEELSVTARVFGADWMPYGTAANRSMLAAFQDELVAQELLAAPLPAAELLPYAVDPTPVLQEVPA